MYPTLRQLFECLDTRSPYRIMYSGGEKIEDYSDYYDEEVEYVEFKNGRYDIYLYCEIPDKLNNWDISCGD